VNESVYFGNWHDGMAEYIKFEVSNPMIEKSGNCVNIPISAKVSNQGTIEEPIPYTIEIKKTVIDFLIREDCEKGDIDYYTNPDNFEDGNSYEAGWFVNPNALFYTVTDFRTGTPSPPNHFYFGVPLGEDQGVYPASFDNAFRLPYIDMEPYIVQDIDIGLEVALSWSYNPVGNVVGPSSHGYADGWCMGTWDPVNNVWLRLSSTDHSGYQDWTVMTLYDIMNGLYGGWSDTGKIETINELVSAHRNIMGFLGYADPGYKISIFFDNFADDTGAIGAPGSTWGGWCMDNINAYSVATGETVWSLDGVTESLEPGEVSEEIKTIWQACDFCDYTGVITTHVDDDWNTAFKGHPTLNYMYNDEAVTWDQDVGNLYIHKKIYDEDFESGGFFSESGEFDPEWSTHDNTFGLPGNWTVCSDGAPGWQENHVLWTGEGYPTYSEHDYGVYMDDVLIPKDEKTGGIKTWNLTDCNTLQLSFDFWQEIEMGAYPWDVFYIEVSNDSGANWWLAYTWWMEWVWPTMNNATVNVEEWMHYDLVLMNNSPLYIMDPCLGTFEMNITDEMTFRLHFNSDSNTQYKGAYVDDLALLCLENETIPMNGHDNTWHWVETVLFEDDFENGLGKWFNINEPTGSMWHISDTCSYPDDTNGHSAAVNDPYPWSSYDLDWLCYSHEDLTYRNNADDKLILDLDLSGVYQAWLTYKVNYTFNDDKDYVVVEINTGDGNWFTIARYTGDSGGWTNQTANAPTGFSLISDWNYGIDISEYAGQPVQIRWRLITNATGTDAGLQLDNVVVYGKEDNEPPVTQALLGPSQPNGCNDWYVSDVTVTLNAQDREMGITKYSIDGGAWLTYTAPFTIGIEGQHTISYYSIDAVGNQEVTKSVSFKIDKTAPTGSLSVPQTGYIYFFGREIMPRILVKDKALIIGGLTAVVTASDATSGVQYVTFTTSQGSFEDAVAPYQYPLPFYFFAGDTLTVTAMDNACNSANIGSVDYFKIF
ncbi:MAG: OmpL47-type beta-barrel domain-containing protein, partial [Thermoplasmatota archaeon]